MLKKARHSPAHLFIDNTAYFITGSIYLKRPLLASDDVKGYLIETIKICFAEKAWQVNDWVILNNHYHLLAMSRKGGDLTKIMRKIHGLSANRITKQTNCSLPVWWNYWDYCPRNEKDYMIRLNYLFNNPIKHGYVESLHDYSFSSFHSFYKNQRRDDLIKQFKEHSDYKNLLLDEDDF